jgi:CrcB protein
MIRTLLFVGAGSCIGGMARYLISKHLQASSFITFPWGTFIVNTIGCLLIGIFYGLFERGNLMNNDLRLFLTVGLCGGFTTFSTFMHENYSFMQNDNFLQVLIYTTLSLVLGLTAVYIGHFIIKLI